jgi:serine-type D-Ala-D-Ala endopeptidase (penicillin-binding protein 7)
VTAMTTIRRLRSPSGRLLGALAALAMAIGLPATAAAQADPATARQATAAVKAAPPNASPQKSAREPRPAQQKSAQQKSTQQKSAQRPAPKTASSTKSAPSRPASANAAPRQSAKASPPRPAQSARAGAPAHGRKVSASPSAVTPRRSLGQLIGLHLVDDPLDLKSSVALVVDQVTGEALYEKNMRAVLPIASITKLMTAIVVLDAGLPLDEVLSISNADRDTEKFSSSRLQPGAQLTRRDMLQLALMSSENRAAHALGRHHPGGLQAFVTDMNRKAAELKMADTQFADPTGLSGRNVSNAHDLSLLVRAAYEYPEIRQFSTALGMNVEPAPRRTLAYRTTNRLVDAPDWDIGLQKTGYISEAGRCLVMQARVEGRAVVIVLLDAAGTHYRMADAQRIRNWLRNQPRSTTAGNPGEPQG